ncbi:MAG: carboxyltransferase domain-containing protein [Opitutaceae bacterium]|nr:carboxyltransferase domain-containing protein [Opitutaceae bacterium]
MTLTPLGDSAVVVALGSVLDDATLRRVGRLAKVLEHDRLVGVVDVVPAFASVTVFYDASQSGGYEHLCAQIAARAQRTEMDEIGGETRMMEIPVCYGGEGEVTDRGLDFQGIGSGWGLADAHVLTRAVENAAVGEFGERGLAGAEHGKRRTHLPRGTAVVAEHRGIVVVGAPLDVVGGGRSHDARRDEQAALLRAELQRDARLKRADGLRHGVGRTVAKFVGPDSDCRARPRAAVVAAAPQVAFVGADVEDFAVGFVDDDLASGIGTDFARRAPGRAAVGAFAEDIAVKREHVAVARGDDVAPAAAVEELLDLERRRAGGNAGVGSDRRATGGGERGGNEEGDTGGAEVHGGDNGLAQNRRPATTCQSRPGSRV